jgi:hypothetical protein
MDEHLERQYLEVELYEKIVVRERRKKIILIVLAFSIFLFLSGIPVYQERFPKWDSLRAAKNIAVELEKVKTAALKLKKPLQFSVLENGKIKIEQVSNCNPVATGSRVVEETLPEKSWMHSTSKVTLMQEIDAKKFNLGMAVQQICFDPVSGLSSPQSKKVFVVVPVKDLAESRLDRASYVELESATAKISIN